MTGDDNRARLGPETPGAGQAVLLTVRFATELALLAVLAVAGATASVGLVWRVLLAILGPVLAAALWGR